MPREVIKIPRLDTRRTTAESARDGSRKEQDHIVSSARFRDFSVRVYSPKSPQKNELSDAQGVYEYSRASMMSSTPYRQKTTQSPVEHKQHATSVKEASDERPLLHSTPVQERKTHRQRTDVSKSLDAPVTSGNQQASTKMKKRAEVSFFSRMSLSHMEDSLTESPPLEPLHMPAAYASEVPYRESVFHFQSPVPSPPVSHRRHGSLFTPSGSSVSSPLTPHSPFSATSSPWTMSRETSVSPASSVSASPPLSPNRKHVVKKLLARRPRTRKDFAQLYIASMQRRRVRSVSQSTDTSASEPWKRTLDRSMSEPGDGPETWDQPSSHSSVSGSRDTIHSSQVLNIGPWLEETQQLISSSSETLSREDYFKAVFFDKSLRRKTDSSDTISGMKNEVHGRTRQVSSCSGAEISLMCSRPKWTKMSFDRRIGNAPDI